ncbi:MAG: Flp pilus assembly complex ATPase component TadA [Lachnospiraceae bacterium]|nr:Flp pilus assembly complex ATPase component TadA [Lachnospiraceae bacterium]
MNYGRRKLRLGDLLVKHNVLTEEALQKGLELQKGSGKKLGEVLVENNICTDEAIADALSAQLNIEKVDLSGVKIDDAILKMAPSSLCRKHNAIPYMFHPGNANVLMLAMSDPMDMVAVDDFTIVTNLQIEVVVATRRQVAVAIDRAYGTADVMSVANKYAEEKANERKEMEAEREEVNAEIDNSPIVSLVKQMVDQAVRQRTSDIHIEPLEMGVRVRYRIDGALYERLVYSTDLLAAIVARIKIISGMDISEKRKPQDGRMTQVVDGQEFDIRVSILPTVYGEKVVMRLTSKTALSREKKDLGLNPHELKQFDHIFSNPHGIILVTGPTGSGKSTTLYTALSELNREEVNIITVEDPVEANINGINQVQVNPKADLTFASALRSILRQDPDIIMIGEIRDGETAGIAVQASITGHLVVSTLHTNSSAGAVGRLIDMGVEPYLLADSIVGIIAQRLVRRLCPNCKKEKIADSEELELLGYGEDSTEEVRIYEPCGCDQCDNTGFKGRIGVYEILEISPKLKRVISKNATAEEIKEVAMEEGMHTLRQSATRYVLDGITSINEMKKVSFDV